MINWNPLKNFDNTPVHLLFELGINPNTRNSQMSKEKEYLNILRINSKLIRLRYFHD